MHGTDRPRCRWAPEGPEDTAAVPVGGGRARQRCPWAAAGPGRSAGERWRGLAGQRGDAPSEARGADGERAGSRPPAHTAARPHNPAQQAPRTPAAPINTTTGTARTRPGTQKTDTRYRMSACGGARGIRTPDLLIANETRYQLRHSPKDGYTLAPSEVSTQADREHQVIAPRTPQRRRDIEDDPDQDDPLPSVTKTTHSPASPRGPLPSATKGPLPSAAKVPRKNRAASPVARGAATTARSSPIGPGARPGRHPGRGQRPDRRRPLRSSGHQPGRSVRWGARESPP